MKTDPSSSILKAQLLVQVSVPGGCSHGILAMPRIRYPLSVAHWLWPCPPPSLFPGSETATAASRGHRGTSVSRQPTISIAILTPAPPDMA